MAASLRLRLARHCGRASVLALLLRALTLPAAADTIYRDPRQPSFTLLVPDGWTATRTNQGVTIAHAHDSFQLGVQNGAGSPGSMLMQIRPQIERQWQDFHEQAAGHVTFGGQSAAYAVYTGVPPSGLRAVERIVSMTNGVLTFTAFESATVEDDPTVRPVLDRIERSFSPDPVK